MALGVLLMFLNIAHPCRPVAPLGLGGDTLGALLPGAVPDGGAFRQDALVLVELTAEFLDEVVLITELLLQLRDPGILQL